MSKLDACPKRPGHREPDWPDIVIAQQPMIEDLVGTLEAQQRAIYHLADRSGRLERATGST